MSRSPAPVAAVAAVLFLLSACSGGDTSAAPGNGAPSPAVTGSASPAAAEPVQPVFSGPAVERFGQEAVLAGHRLATGFVMRGTFDGALMNETDLSRGDLAFLETDMTPQAAKAWRDLAVKIEKDTATAAEFEQVFLLATIRLLTLTEDAQPVEPPFRGAGLLASTPSLGAPVEGSEEPTLVLEFPVLGELLLKDAAGVQLATRLTKDMTITLAATGDAARPWAVQAWTGTRFLTDLRPDKSF